LAINAQLNQPVDIAIDSKGNLYIADTGNFRIRKVAPVGTITTVAGCGQTGSLYSSQATAVYLGHPNGIAVDSDGNLYIADFNRVRKVTADGKIGTLAGTEVPGFSGDGGPATAAQISVEGGIALDASGNLFITDRHNCIRKVADARTVSVAGNELQSLRRKAEQGDALAQNRLGYAYCCDGGVTRDYSEAVRWFKKAAEQGHPASQFGLASLYSSGNGVAKDLSCAAKWYRKAAEQGYTEAQIALALMHSKGDGVSKDLVETVRWLQKAAEQDSQEAQQAQFLLGGFYLVEDFGPQDLRMAFKWLYIAAAGSSQEVRARSSDLKNKIARIMTTSQIAEAQKLALDWLAAHGR
jgi:hypothetical protein